jgi:hypothetical protein
MIQFRPFRNDDTPALVELWQGQPAMRGMVQPVNASILERYVFSKLYFDRHGLIVAHSDDRMLGVAHAGFGPNDELTWIGRENGVISLILVTTEFPEREALARQLIERAETYLQSHGARRVYGGEYYPHSPFYFGLYGGSNAA